MVRCNNTFHALLIIALSLALQIPLALATNTTTLPPPTNVTDSSTVPPSDADGDIREGSPSPALSYFGGFQDFGSICGASLIYGDIALTAAHCVASSFPGSLRFNSQNRNSGGIKVSVTSRTLHPAWTGSITSADLAILKLGTFLSLTPATVNSNGDSPASDGVLMKAAGFGLTGASSGVSNTLQATTIPYIADCSSRISSFNNERMVCGDSRSTATCGGDSGSPVLLDGTLTQIGVNSFSDGNCDTQTIDVYTRVSYYSSWIQQQICDQSSNPPASCSESNLSPMPTRAPTAAPPPTPCFFWAQSVGLRGSIANFFGW